MKFPCIIINMKTYSESLGTKGIVLARKLEKTVLELDGNVYLCPQYTDLRNFSNISNLPTLSQGINSYPPGAYTGHVTAESIKDAGCSGTLLNHSENPISNEEIKKCIEILRKAGLFSVVCVPDTSKISEIALMEPDAIAIEPPELIGGNISVSNARPELIKEAVIEAGSIPILCGAGVKTGIDVKKAIELGAKGILVASGIVKAEKPESVLQEFIVNLK